MQLHETMIAEVAARVLESMAFAMVMPGPDEPGGELEQSSEPHVQASVRFHGPVDGLVTVTLPRATLNELTENMLAVTDDSTAAQAQLDALGELANVICGNLLPEMAGAEAVFNLDRPEVSEVPTPTVAAGSPAETPPDSALAGRARLTMATGWVEVGVEELAKANALVSR